MALKNRLAPSDQSRSLAIEQRYQRLCNGPGTQDIEMWLDQWITTYTEAKKIPIGEVARTRPIRDFLMAIKQQEPSFAHAHLIQLKDKIDSDEIYELIEDFRQQLSYQKLQQRGGGEHTAFATKSSTGASFRGQSQGQSHPLQPTKPCVCGDTHWILDCLYLVPGKRSQGWQPNSTKQKKVTDALQDSRTKAWVDRIFKKKKRYDNNRSQNQPSSSSSTPTAGATNQSTESGAFICTIQSAAFPSATESMRTSWILDNGSNSHVCNSTMFSRFTKTKDAFPSDTLRAGTQIIPIESFGTIRISILAPTSTGYTNMTLLNVAYVSEFHTNLVSQSILASKGVYFDGWKNELHRDGNPIAFVESSNGHYFMEKNLEIAEPSITGSSFAVKSETMSEWHQVLGHPSHETIKHLESATQGVKVSDINTGSVPKTNECETCALFKSHQIISRSPDKSESSTKLFYRVTYDLMQFDPALNKHQWVSHFAYSITDFNLVFTHARKSDATSIIKEAVAMME